MAIIHFPPCPSILRIRTTMQAGDIVQIKNPKWQQPGIAGRDECPLCGSMTHIWAAGYTCWFDGSTKSCPDGWIEVLKVCNKIEKGFIPEWEQATPTQPEAKGPHLCRCEKYDVINFGCKCGGI